MRKAITLAALAVALCFSQGVKAQTNFQTFYDFSKDRGYVTTTLEGFHQDNYGNTFFFIDYDYKNMVNNRNVAPNGTYFEIARCLNFWQDTELAPLSIQLEYNGGVYNAYNINNAFLFGVDYFLHSSDFKNTLNLKVLGKYIVYDNKDTHSKVPLQFTAVWGMQDLFGVKGLRFSGFADFWWQEHTVFPYEDKDYNYLKGEVSHVVFLSEPQIWYNCGTEHFNIGGELELSYDFGSSKGFWARPCLGFKWVF